MYYTHIYNFNSPAHYPPPHYPPRLSGYPTRYFWVFFEKYPPKNSQVEYFLTLLFRVIEPLILGFKSYILCQLNYISPNSNLEHKDVNDVCSCLFIRVSHNPWKEEEMYTRPHGCYISSVVSTFFVCSFLLFKKCLI